MKQYEAVLMTIEKLGGIATLGQINQEIFNINDCEWKSKTPFASIRRIVQLDKNIYRINENVVFKTKKTLIVFAALIVPIAILTINFDLKYFLNLSFSVYFYIIAVFYVFPSFLYGIDIVALFKQNQEWQCPGSKLSWICKPAAEQKGNPELRAG